MILAFELLERSKGSEEVSADEGDSHDGPWCSLACALGNRIFFCFAFNFCVFCFYKFCKVLILKIKNSADYVTNNFTKKIRH